MGTKVTSSSGSVLEESEIQKLQMQAKNSKENSLNKLNALKTTIQHLSSSNPIICLCYLETCRIWKCNSAKKHFTRRIPILNYMRSKGSLNISYIQRCLSYPIKYYTQCSGNILQDFNAYTTMEAQTFKETIIQNMDSIEQCIIERASHEQELKMTLKRLSERQLQIQQCKVQEVQSSVTSSGDETSSRIVSDEEIDKQKLEAHSSYMAKIQEVSPDESSSTDTPLEQVQIHDENDVFANVRRHSEQPGIH
ncbi:hypothetical protein Tco_0494107 [Tanacetum coccineum]